MFDIKPHQIIYLEHQNTRLYVEVIQMVKARQLCWARPLALAQKSSPAEKSIAPEFFYLESDKLSLYALDESPDILWPIELFHPALDTEVLPLLSRLGAQKQKGDPKVNRQYLSRFIYQLWAANQTAFAEKAF
ncbi:MAG: hypothetical protein MJA27_19840 [Pseudanabaenales cyanobacterium]|nr:hypothetical protein [Pseudanabaenales cyanobacterium]